MITNIPISKLEPHPDNPRRELGNLSELAASIRRQGILQNLTVVPSPDNPGKYRIVIGHRRFSAAGIVGLAELPCTIDECMTYADQIAAMMSENIQRNDLTVTERVGGVQMMMDLGMDVGAISTSTGISDTTVRRYAKLTKLNRGGMYQAEGRGATLMQFIEINEIANDTLRAEALDAVGTDKYTSVIWKVKNSIRREKILPGIHEKLRGFATRVDKEDYSKYDYVDVLYFHDDNSIESKIKTWLDKKGTHVYCVGESRIELLKERPRRDDAKEQAKIEARERLDKKIRDEKELSERFNESRKDFLLSAGSYTWSDYVAVLRFSLWVTTRTSYQQPPDINGILAKAIPDPQRASTSSLVLSLEDVCSFSEKTSLLRALAFAAYDRITTGELRMMDRYTGKYNANETVTDLYKCMESLGYLVSTEERMWLDGTHECFQAVNA